MDAEFFATAAEFRSWLQAHHDSADELWVGYYKVASEKTGIGYAESVEEAICFGWIDGLVQRIDEERYRRRFTPRRHDSKWAKSNVERVKRMVDAGKMTPAGMEPVEAAKESGAWDAAYRVGDDHEVPPELEDALKRNEKAWKHFQELSNTNQHVYITRVREAGTPETRKKRIEKIVELAEQDLPPHDEDGKPRI